MNAQGIERFQDGVQALLLTQPFFGTLLMKLRHEPKPCGTLYVDGRVLGFDPDFMAQQDIEQAQFCAGHEVLHCAWMHLPRIKHYIDLGIGPDGKPLDHETLMKAVDYPINASLVQSGIGKIPAGIEICLDATRFPPEMTPEEVYCELRKDAQQQQQQGGGGGKKPGKGQPLDQHVPCGSGDEDGDGSGDGDGEGSGRSTRGPAITAADVLQAANVCKAMRGTLPAGIDRLLGELKKPDRSPWRRLRQAVTTALAGYDASSWRRLHRRLIVRGIGVPGRVMQGAGKIGIVGDTSGSIGQEMLNLFFGHMAAIMDDARPQEVRVYWTDAKVHRVDVVKNATALRALATKPVPGGGGTNMPEGVEAAEDDGCDVIVVLTDGYTPFCASKKKVVWAITSQVKSPYGETLHIG